MIQLEGIQFNYPRGEILFKNLNLSLNSKERVALIGPNGSGKSTLLSLLVGLEKPTNGVFTVSKRIIQSDKDLLLLRKKIGLVVQDPNDQLFCPTIMEDVIFGPLNMGCSREDSYSKGKKALHQLGIEEFKSRLTHKLSWGEKRLVGLASVLSMEPEFLLLDEPDSGLDPKSRKNLESLLLELPCGQLIASHNMEFIRKVCTKVIVINNGKIIAQGKTDDIIGNEDLMNSNGLEVPYSLLK